MADTRQERKDKGTLTDEDVGVQLPFIRLTLSMTTIMVFGLIPLAILGFAFYYAFVNLANAFWIKISILLISPVVAWGFLFLYFVLTAIVTRGFLMYYEKRNKAQTGVFSRQFKDKKHPDYRNIHYYHMRGAIVKYSLWIVQKSPFPSLVSHVLNFYKHNHIGQRVLYENCFIGLEFTDIGDEAVIEVGSALSAHVVESLYGNLIIDYITIQKRGIVGVNTVVGPGVNVAEENQVGDNCMTFSNWPLVGCEGNDEPFFNGSPAKQANIEMLFADDAMKQEFLDRKNEM
jgi:hypothetical protein